MRIDGGAWTPWYTHTTSLAGTYPAERGRTYGFRVTATVPFRFAAGMLR